MDPRIRELYEATRYDGVEAEPIEEPPVTHVKVFRKQYPRLPKVDLPPVEVAGELWELLDRRRSTREFSEEGITLDQLAAVLHACRIVDLERQPERRTYASAGARFPVEIYPVAFEVRGLERGCYHYDMLENRLELLWRRDLGSRQAELVTEDVVKPAAALVLTAQISRSAVKYGPKAYPYALLEAGQVSQNLSLACEATGLGYCPIGGFVNRAVEEILDLTSEEIPVCVLAVGSRPR